LQGKTLYRLKQIDRDGNFEYSGNVEVTIENAPNIFTLEQNFPNPLNPSTTIRYGLPFSSRVSLRIFDILGQQVEVLVNTEQEPGWHETQWNSKVSSGIYFYQIDVVSTSDPSKHFTKLSKMLLIK